MEQIRKTIGTLMTAAICSSAMMLGTGCADTAVAPGQANANGVRSDVTDVRPMVSATPPAYQPPLYDTTGSIPTTPQAMTPDPVVAVAPSTVTTVTTVTPDSTDKIIGGKKTHKVLKGETLFSIARTTYGNGKAWTKIVSANPGLSPSKLKVGQVLVLPA